jgi:phenylalanyl-tRNA synthetase alpha chain
VHARVDGGSVEILECGLAAPQVLDDAGLPSSECNGLAMGIGLDRMLMLRKGIGDIRELRSADPRVASQMLDLEPYRAVSTQPAIRRDLSIAVAQDTMPEELGDRARHALGPRCSSVEAIEVVGETQYAELPSAARERLGISAAQKNVLLRVVIRDLERTLTAEEANALRDEVYAALHEGSVHSWARKR